MPCNSVESKLTSEISISDETIETVFNQIDNFENTYLTNRKPYQPYEYPIDDFSQFVDTHWDKTGIYWLSVPVDYRERYSNSYREARIFIKKAEDGWKMLKDEMNIGGNPRILRQKGAEEIDSLRALYLIYVNAKAKMGFSFGTIASDFGSYIDQLNRSISQVKLLDECRNNGIASPRDVGLVKTFAFISYHKQEQIWKKGF